MSNFLDRRLSLALPSESISILSPSQQEADQLLKGFVHQATDWKNLAAMTMGGFAYRLGKTASYALPFQYSPLLTKTIAPTIGLAAEVSSFRWTHHLLENTDSILHSSWFTDYVNFSSLKLFGKMSQDQNLCFAHFLQDTGMVMGHQLAYGLNLATQPEGSLAQQFMNAEMTNLAMSAGISLAHSLSGGTILRSEKILELVLEVKKPKPFLNPSIPDLVLKTSIWRSGENSEDQAPNTTLNNALDPNAKTVTAKPEVDPNGSTDISSPGAPPDRTPVQVIVHAADPAATRIVNLDPTSALSIGGEITTNMRLGPEGRFKMVKMLGSGGFGDVYQVYDQKLERMAVIKVPKEGRSSEALLKRFDREIKIGANLDPRYTVIVYDKVELKDGLQVPVMEFVPGSDLSKIIHLSATNVDSYDYARRLQLFAEICEAMESAHRRGILHRDLKPENIRLTEDDHIRIMDWGIATTFTDASPDSQIAPDHLVFAGSKLTQQGTWAGTIGYVAPEIMDSKPLKNPASPDIFALGVILWEMMGRHHPFMSYKKAPPDEQQGPLKIPIYHKDGSPQMGLYASAIGPSTAPKLHEVIEGNYPNYLHEIELIAQKAFNPDPSKRYQSVQELREAVLLAFARSEQNQISEIQTNMQAVEKRMHEIWDQFQIGHQIQLGQWEAMHQPISELREMRASWKQKALDLVKYLEITFMGRPPAEAKKMIAELCWKILLDEGDTISIRERQSLEKLIRTYDVATLEDPSTSMKDALTGLIKIDIQVKDRTSGEIGIPRMTRVRLLKFFPDQNSEGVPLLTYQAKEIFDASLQRLITTNEAQGILLNEGYYVFEITHTGYTTIRVPVHITLQDVRRYLQNDKAFIVNAQLIPIHSVPKNMSIVQGGTAWTGMDYFSDPNPLDKHSFPLRRVEYDTFAITRYPITITQYQSFVEAVLEKINTHLANKEYHQAAELVIKARHYIPRGQLHLDTMKDLLENPSPEKLSQAFKGVKYNWKVTTEGEGDHLRFKLTDPTSHRSAANEEIFAEQPIHAIPMTAIQAYIEWRNFTEGRDESTGLYRLPERQELEIIARNTFPWPYPWGYLFNPNFLESRLIHQDVDQGAVAKAVGTHSLGNKYYRDRSIFDVYDLLGNARKITQTEAEAGCVYCFGGSVRTPFGPYFLPSALLYAGRNTVNEYNSSFYLVLPLTKTRP